MSITNEETTNLGINVLGYSEYDLIQNKLTNELYVVKNTNADTDNAISSRTYADVGRYAVHYGPNAPTSEFAKIWVDTSEDPVIISPASINMDNLSITGIENLQSLITPNFSIGTALSLTSGGVYTMSSTGWIYITTGTSSEVRILYENSTGNVLTHLKTATDIASDKLFLKKGDKMYIDTLSGSVSITLYPCRSSV